MRDLKVDLKKFPCQDFAHIQFTGRLRVKLFVFVLKKESPGTVFEIGSYFVGQIGLKEEGK